MDQENIGGLEYNLGYQKCTKLTLFFIDSSVNTKCRGAYPGTVMHCTHFVRKQLMKTEPYRDQNFIIDRGTQK